jgi:hypothetical protein
MNKRLLISLVLTLCCTNAFAHSGRTDSNGGHNCSQTSIDKGLCSGYHYHNGESYSDLADGHEGHANATHTHNEDNKKATLKENETAQQN